MTEFPAPRVEVQINEDPENPDYNSYGVWLIKDLNDRSTESRDRLGGFTTRAAAVRKGEKIARLIGWPVVIATLQRDGSWAESLHALAP